VGTTTTDATGAKSATLANLTEAYEWAVNVVHADVVSVSIGSIIPTTPAVDHILFESFDRSIHRAMENGTLTIVSGGNGIEDACGPTFSWLSSFSYSDAAIAVGSLSEDASQPLLVSCSAFQPDISSGGNAVHGACIASDTCYDETLSGTSFAAPRVAGGAATLLREAIAGGPDLGARHLRDLVLSCVVDDVWPYATEGAGFFNQPAVDRGLSHARDGTLCPYSSTFNVASNQADTQREGQLAHTMKHLQGHNMVVVDQDGFLRIPDQRVLVPVAAATTGPVVMGASTPAAFEIQRYDVRLAPGQRFTATASWAPDGTTDMDLYLVPAGKVGVGAYFPALAVQQSANGADVMESIDHTTIAGGDYTLLLVGFAVPASTTVTVTTSSGTYAGEDLAVGNLVL
jgi:subtilisin family serine protease